MCIYIYIYIMSQNKTVRKGRTLRKHRKLTRSDRNIMLGGFGNSGLRTERPAPDNRGRSWWDFFNGRPDGLTDEEWQILRAAQRREAPREAPREAAEVAEAADAAAIVKVW